MLWNAQWFSCNVLMWNSLTVIFETQIKYQSDCCCFLIKCFQSFPSEKTQRDQHFPLQVTPLKIGTHPVEVQYYALDTPKPAPRSKVSSMTSSIEIPKVPSPNQIRSSSPSLQQSAVHFPRWVLDYNWISLIWCFNLCLIFL